MEHLTSPDGTMIAFDRRSAGSCPTRGAPPWMGQSHNVDPAALAPVLRTFFLSRPLPHAWSTARTFPAGSSGQAMGGS